MQYQIREATDADLAAIQRIYANGDAVHRAAAPWFFRETDGPARSEAFLRESLDGASAAILLAEDPEQGAIGLLHMYERSSPKVDLFVSRRFVMIESLIVLPEAQRRGIATALMCRAEAWALARGVDQVELGVWEWNAGAQRLYASLGYATVRRSLWKQLGAPGEAR